MRAKQGTKKWMRIFKITACFGLLAACYLFVSRTLSKKLESEGNQLWDLYLQPKDTVDVLFLGSSHSGQNLDLTVFWSEYGISAFNAWSPWQTFDLSYYWLKEALKSQRPKVIVLEVFAATYKIADGSETNGDLVLAINQIKYNSNKIRSIMTSVDPQCWINFLLHLPIMHKRYGELKEIDFQNYAWNKENVRRKGQYNWYELRNAFQLYDPRDVTETAKLDPAQEEYLIRVIETCQEQGIPLIMIKTPTGQRSKWQPYYNRVAQIAEEYKIPFVNYNVLDEETGLIPSDSYDGSHLNVHGTRKIGRHLADYIVARYELEDHRGDPRYASWDAFVEDTRNEWLQKEWELPEWFSLAKSRGDALFLIKNDPVENAELVDIFFRKIGLSQDELEQKEHAVWVSENTALEPLTERCHGGLTLETYIGNQKFYFNFTNRLEFVYKDRAIPEAQEADWLALVYDRKNENVVDLITINAETGEFQHISTEKEMQDY